MNSIRIVLADDHDIVRSGLHALLDAYEGMEVVGEARDGLEALERVEILGPDVVVMDLSMPRMDGAEATRRIAREHPNVRVVVLSAHDDREHVTRLQQAGAAGYVVKRSATRELIRAIEVVMAGGTFLDPHLDGGFERDMEVRRGPDAAPTAAVLSEEEAAVLRALADGQTLGHIVASLQMDPGAVETHRARIREKLGLRTRADILRYAHEQRWIGDG